MSEDETLYYHEVLIKCSNSKCGHMFEADEKTFIKSASILCRKCGGLMNKEEGKFDEMLLFKCPRHNVPLKHYKPPIIYPYPRDISLGKSMHIWNCPIEGCNEKKEIDE